MARRFVQNDNKSHPLRRNGAFNFPTFQPSNISTKSRQDAGATA
jgi:hypothetical protein